jgi:SAM-dependent methyltransferase
MTLERIRADWTRLGSADPLWAVLVRPDLRHGQWQPEEFLATGRAEVTAALQRAWELGARPGRRRAVDFGCGAGRLSQALAERVDEVVAVDVAAPMLETARQLDTTRRVRFVLNVAEDLRFIESESVDISFTSLVLQHLPPDLACRYLAELVRILRPGGLLVAQTASAPDYSLKGRLARLLPGAALRAAQRHLLRYPAPMEMHGLSTESVRAVVTAAGARLLASDADPMYGGHWTYSRHFAVRA